MELVGAASPGGSGEGLAGGEMTVGVGRHGRDIGSEEAVVFVDVFGLEMGWGRGVVVVRVVLVMLWIVEFLLWILRLIVGLAQMGIRLVLG